MMTDTSVEYVRLGSDTCSIQRMEERKLLIPMLG